MTQHESDAQGGPAQPDLQSPSAAAPAPQPRNPLHGVKLEQIVTELADTYGWSGLAERIPIRCFSHEPSVGSSLKFLRKTPWARDKVEGLYLFSLREKRRQEGAQGMATRRHTP